MNLIPLNDETRALAESLVWFESSEVAPPRPIQPASWPILSFDWWLTHLIHRIYPTYV